MKYIAFLLSFLISFQCFTQNRILLDGIFEDWEDQEISYTDATGDGGSSGTDFGKLQIYNDENYIFFLLEIGNEINFQDNNNITIYIDTDGNAATGSMINGIGAELAYTFGERSGFVYLSGNTQEIYQDDIFLVSAPTVSSSKFELVIKREATFFGSPLFPNDNFQLVFKDNSTNGDILPDNNGGVSYIFSVDLPEPLPVYSIQKKTNADLRVLSYNVLSDGLFDASRVSSFTRILQAIRPEIIGFQEIYDHSSSQVADQVESMLPSTTGEEWFHANAGSDIHAISRYPILESYTIEGNGAFLIDLPDIDENLLFIIAHPPCCNNDEGRQMEIDAMMAFLRNAKEGIGPLQLQTDAPIIIVGDMNLVGDRQQLETLLTGNIADEFTYGADFEPDWDGSNLKDSRPYTTHLPMSFTWFNEESRFSPGRLDFNIHTGSNLILQNTYSLFTRSLPEDSLSTYGLLPNDVVLASDHLPVVADFKLKNSTTINNPKSNNTFQIKVSPNPSSGLMSISFDIHEASFVTLQMFDLLGNEVATILHKNLRSGAHNIQFNPGRVSDGIYFLSMSTAEFTSDKLFLFIN